MTAKKNGKKSKHGTRKVAVDKRIVEELAKWGIDKKTVGAAGLTILITAILRLIGVGASRIGDVEMSEEDFHIADVLDELREEKVLGTITAKVPKETLARAIRTVVADDGILWEYDVDDIPSYYSEMINKDLIEFFESQYHP